MRTPRQWLNDQRQSSRGMDWPKAPEGSRWDGRRLQVTKPIDDLGYQRTLADWQRQQREARQAGKQREIEP